MRVVSEYCEQMPPQNQLIVCDCVYVCASVCVSKCVCECVYNTYKAENCNRNAFVSGTEQRTKNRWAKGGTKQYEAIKKPSAKQRDKALKRVSSLKQNQPAGQKEEVKD